MIMNLYDARAEDSEQRPSRITVTTDSMSLSIEVKGATMLASESLRATPM